MGGKDPTMSARPVQPVDLQHRNTTSQPHASQQRRLRLTGNSAEQSEVAHGNAQIALYCMQAIRFAVPYDDINMLTHGSLHEKEFLLSFHGAQILLRLKGRYGGIPHRRGDLTPLFDDHIPCCEYSGNSVSISAFTRMYPSFRSSSPSNGLVLGLCR